MSIITETEVWDETKGKAGPISPSIMLAACMSVLSENSKMREISFGPRPYTQVILELGYELLTTGFEFRPHLNPTILFLDSDSPRFCKNVIAHFGKLTIPDIELKKLPSWKVKLLSDVRVYKKRRLK